MPEHAERSGDAANLIEMILGGIGMKDGARPVFHLRQGGADDGINIALSHGDRWWLPALLRQKAALQPGPSPKPTG